MSGLGLYRALLHLYPARFREEYAEPLERAFLDDYREVQTRRARTALWLRLFWDLAVSLPPVVAGELRQDLQYSLRMYARRPVSTVLAVSALAVAIGATTGVFGVVNAALLRSLPFRDSQQLVEFFQAFPRSNTPAELAAWRRASHCVEDASKFMTSDMNLARGGESVRVKVTETSDNFFAMLGSDMLAGRSFAHGEDTPGKGDVAVLSHAFWQQFLGGDPRVLGSTVRLSGVPLTVIGIARPGMDYPGKTAVWTPTVYDWEHLPKTGVTFWRIVVRLKDGLTVEQATPRMLSEVAQTTAGDPRKRGPALKPLREELAGPVRSASMVLMGAVVFVLLIACANIANLLLTRMSERQSEIALRAALGASRARLTQQLTTECLVLTTLAAVAGMVVAQWAVRLAGAVQPLPLATQEYTLLDWRVLAFAAALALTTGLAFGVFPAWMLGRLQPVLGTSREQGPSRGASRIRTVLVVAQVALTLTLLAGATVMTRSFADLLDTDIGFKTDHVVAVSVSLAGTRVADQKSERSYVAAALESLRQIPGVKAAGAVDFLPLDTNSFMGTGFKVDSGESVQIATVVTASAGYFRAMSTPVVQGREFAAADTDLSERVALVNEEFVREAGIQGGVVGRRLVSGWTSQKPLTIVGVVKSVRYGGPATTPMAQVYLPMTQQSRQYATFVARVDGKAEDHVTMCRDALSRVDREVPVFDAMPLNAKLARVLAKPRFYTVVVLFFGVFSVLLAALGIFGVASYSIGQRTREIGVRMAVGAPAGRVRNRMVAESLVPIAAGILLGMGGAMALGQFMRHLMQGARNMDPVACGCAVLILGSVAFATLWSASQRILRLDPATVLRSE